MNRDLHLNECSHINAHSSKPASYRYGRRLRIILLQQSPSRLGYAAGIAIVARSSAKGSFQNKQWSFDEDCRQLRQTSQLCRSRNSNTSGSWAGSLLQVPLRICRTKTRLTYTIKKKHVLAKLLLQGSPNHRNQLDADTLRPP